MEIISGITEFHIENSTVVTLGKFDGIHMGHMTLINKSARISREKGLGLCVFTFDVLPTVMSGKYEASQITTNIERRKMFADAGVDYLIEYPFNEETKNMEPLDFIENVIHRKLNASYVVVGNDWHFGRDRSGDTQTLMSAGMLYGFETNIIEKESYNQREISSTWIRNEIAVGNMENVNILLGYPYMIMGEVEHGNHLGAKMGFPTVNIYPPEEKLLPPNGVYSSNIVLDGRKYNGITNIGVRPTVADSDKISVETNIFDFSENLYGKVVTIELLHFQRPEMKFDSVEKLIAQVEADRKFTREFFLM